jgi:glutaminase
MRYLILSLFLVFNCAVSFSETILPSNFKTTLYEVYKKFQSEKSGKNASYIPELAKANPNHFAISIATIDGEVFSVGDADVPFSLQSLGQDLETSPQVS